MQVEADKWKSHMQKAGDKYSESVLEWDEVCGLWQDIVFGGLFLM